jgi:hypothetical protein
MDQSTAIQRDYKSQVTWTWTWLIIYVILTALFIYIFAVAKDSDVKHLALIIFIQTALGIVGIFISALTGNVGEGVPKSQFLNIFANPLKPYVGKSGGGEGAETALGIRAFMEKAAQAPQMRVVAPAVVIILNLILWLAFKQWAFALFNAIIGVGMTQCQYYTQPTAAMEYFDQKAAKAA